jgi:hypothetical protein
MKNTENTTRKRSRTSEDAEDAAVTSGSKKARGRPRVDTQDATAADVSDSLCLESILPHKKALLSRPCCLRRMPC